MKPKNNQATASALPPIAQQLLEEIQDELAPASTDFILERRNVPAKEVHLPQWLKTVSDLTNIPPRQLQLFTQHWNLETRRTVLWLLYATRQNRT